jgi:4-hydroxybenzoate polyprenyltransferase
VEAVAERAPTLKALRIWQWKHFVLLPAAVLQLSSPARAAAQVAVACVVAALALAYAYGLNAITDRADDDDAGKNPLVGLPVLPRATLPLVASTACFALLLAALLGPLAAVATALSLAASTVYSAGPRWKAVPIFGTLLNAVIFVPLTVTGGLPQGGFALRLASFVALLLQNQLIHELADAREDARARVFTTGHLLGERGVATGVAALGILGAIVGFALAPPPVALVNGVALALVTLAILRTRSPAAKRRTMHRALAVLAGAVIFTASLGAP